jgi:hypothetical protein
VPFACTQSIRQRGCSASSGLKGSSLQLEAVQPVKWGATMLKAQYLKRILEAQPGEPPKVEAVILYEDFTCGLRLKYAIEELFNEVFSQVGWAAHYRLSLWSFQKLRARTVCAMAARESANASVFAVALDGGQQLVPEITSLVQEWLARRDGQSCALVVAGYGHDPVALRSSSAGTFLRSAAKRTGQLFLVHPLGQALLRSLQAVEGKSRWLTHSQETREAVSSSIPKPHAHQETQELR